MIKKSSHSNQVASSFSEFLVVIIMHPNAGDLAKGRSISTVLPTLNPRYKKFLVCDKISNLHWIGLKPHGCKRVAVTFHRNKDMSRF